jgi:hypothetical protein
MFYYQVTCFIVTFKYIQETKKIYRKWKIYLRSYIMQNNTSWKLNYLKSHWPLNIIELVRILRTLLLIEISLILLVLWFSLISVYTLIINLIKAIIWLPSKTSSNMWSVSMSKHLCPTFERTFDWILYNKFVEPFNLPHFSSIPISVFLSTCQCQ